MDKILVGAILNEGIPILMLASALMASRGTVSKRRKKSKTKSQDLNMKRKEPKIIGFIVIKILSYRQP